MSSVVAEDEDRRRRRAGWDLRWAAPVMAGGAAWAEAAAEGESAEPGGQGEPGMEVAASPSEAERERRQKLEVNIIWEKGRPNKPFCLESGVLASLVYHAIKSLVFS